MGFHQTNNSKNKIAGIFDLPDESCRVLKDEIQGEEEFNEQLLRVRGAGGAKMDDDIFDKNFHAGGKAVDFAFDHDDGGMNTAIGEEDIEDGRKTVMIGNRNQ